MKFDFFNEKVNQLTHLPLPGENAQFLMSPPYRQELMKLRQQVIKKSKKAAVLALFYPDFNGETHLVLIKRKTYKGVHSAQLAFPGGKVEAIDKNFEETALRETEEEIGVSRKSIEIIKPLTQLYIPPSNFEVFPFLGKVAHTPTFIKQESEVEDILAVSLQNFLNDSCVCKVTVPTSYNIEVEVPAFNFDGQIVWGATAMMMSEIKSLFQNVLQ
ncbi:CoA pyrophosphatase [Paucihalobacter ruber]|uniref:CoA pyrophosphatase n=1 Tax=Paucihalobacter ruber TaxID=2567861 RepID=A0A506PJH2_9FLAO|nr:CoA pyrophosphatase [Paucihalobacter ruber]TPV33941.1 CoA pyrophosphatase [Paucihalobacter ruber]